MKKRFLAVLMTTILVFSMVACGGNSKKDNTTPKATEEKKEESSSTVEVDETLTTVELTVPADMVGEMTQEELDGIVEEEGYKSATLNEDGSVTYVMTKKQHKEMMTELSEQFDSTLNEMIGSEDYPNVTKIEENENYTLFKVTTKSEVLTMEESFSVLTFYIMGGMYNTYNNTPVDNICVKFINEASGEVIHTANSSEMTE